MVTTTTTHAHASRACASHPPVPATKPVILKQTNVYGAQPRLLGDVCGKLSDGVAVLHPELIQESDPPSGPQDRRSKGF